MVLAADEAIGNVTDALSTKGMMADAILVVSSDNGGWIGYGGLNYPYRGHKTTLWEGGVRAIGLVVAPNRVPAGARYAHLFHVTDWMPTLASAAGASDLGELFGPPFRDLDGVDQWAALSAAGAPGSAPPRAEILHNIEGIGGSGAAVLRVGEWKLMRNMQAGRGFDGWCDVCERRGGCFVPSGAGPSASDATVPYGGQLCCWSPPVDGACAPVNRTQTLPELMLFHIATDPSETKDVARANPHVVARLASRLDECNASATPCCICTGSGRTSEMDVPPRDGVWYSFRDQGPNPDPNCALLNQPPWRDVSPSRWRARSSSVVFT